MEAKEKILKKSEELFLQYGLKSVTMDDLASQLGMSKKTLYQFVENKGDLIEQIIDLHISDEKAFMESTRATSKDAVEEMILVARHNIQELKKLSPTVIYDLKKYYQHLWLLIEQLESEHTFDFIKSNIERGMNQGVYRADINADIITKIYVLSTMSVVNEKMFSQKIYKKEELFTEFIKYHLQGITTEKGLMLYKKYLKK